MLKCYNPDFFLGLFHQDGLSLILQHHVIKGSTK